MDGRLLEKGASSSAGKFLQGQRLIDVVFISSFTFRITLPGGVS